MLSQLFWGYDQARLVASCGGHSEYPKYRATRSDALPPELFSSPSSQLHADLKNTNTRFDLDIAFQRIADMVWHTIKPVILAGLELAIFGSEDQRLIH